MSLLWGAQSVPLSRLWRFALLGGSDSGAAQVRNGWKYILDANFGAKKGGMWYRLRPQMTQQRCSAASQQR
jgi:hypothetical protein